MDHIDEWRKRHGESRNLETSRWTGIVVYDMPNIGGGLDLHFNVLLIKNLQKRN
jgi:hypothetical protein